MARDNIRSGQIQVNEDNGAILFSQANTEQFQYEAVAGWLTTLEGYTITGTITEGGNATRETGKAPTTLLANGVVTTILTFKGEEGQDANEYGFIIPKSIGTTYTTKAMPDAPVYGFITIVITEPDTVSEARRQSWEPIRGLVEFRI